MSNFNIISAIFLMLLVTTNNCFGQSDDYDVLFRKQSQDIDKTYSDQISTSRVKLYWSLPVKIIYKCSSRKSGWSRPLYLPPNIEAGYIDFSKRGCGADSKRIDIIIEYGGKIHHKELNVSGGKKYTIRVDDDKILFNEVYSKEGL
jgi:hypothetical protein